MCTASHPQARAAVSSPMLGEAVPGLGLAEISAPVRRQGPPCRAWSWGSSQRSLRFYKDLERRAAELGGLRLPVITEVNEANWDSS